MTICPKCNKENRREAKFCHSCGAGLSPTQTLLPDTSQAVVRLSPLLRNSILNHSQDSQQRYGILVAHELSYSIYYSALDLTCPDCELQQPDVPPNGLCQQCQSPLPPVLIRERRLCSDGPLTESDIGQLIHLSAAHPGIVAHQTIIQYTERAYTIVNHPGRWDVLMPGRQQRSPDEAIACVAQVGRALVHLHDSGFAHSEMGDTNAESIIVVGDKGNVKIADLSACVRLPANDTSALQTQIKNDIAFLGWLLFYLATGEELSRSNIESAPPALRTFVQRAVQREYTSVQDLSTDFSLLPALPSPTRSLKPSHGQATHPGQQHPHNEDAVTTFTFDKEQGKQSVPIGFYLVADGMGGHDAGDVASRTVNQVVTDWIINTKVLPNLRKATRRLTAETVPAELLVQAIEQANKVLLRHGQMKDANPGSTVTAVLVIGDVATIINVGDSRTYLLRSGQLEQITHDHSLVARLVDTGVIEPEQVRSHPQRNQIYRCLGDKVDVKVDTFTRQLQTGDMLVLCSDGLWEMVLDDEIQRIIQDAHSPQKACDALVKAANRAGGDDNIAVIIVEME